MKRFKNNVIIGAEERPIALDIFYKEEGPMPVVIYAHGFNGFKDWASFDIIAEQFAEAGFCFVKFNFSHNGTTPESPEDFVDLEAFGNNNYTKELYDLQVVIDWVLDENNPHCAAISVNYIFLIGHSMGGGIVLLKGAEEKRIRGITSWASIPQCKTPWGNWPQERIEKWKETGVEYYTNSRTAQQMPLYYQLYEDYQANSEQLNIIKAVQQLDTPLLICHGTNDEAVSVSSAFRIKDAAHNAELFLVESDHVFGRKHPWPHQHLPEAAQAVVDRTMAFFQQIQ